MSSGVRQVVSVTLTKPTGEKYQANLIENPTIDDVVESEMKLAAFTRFGGPLPADHRVDRGIRNFLIKQGETK